jgi:hypothetical protein
MNAKLAEIAASTTSAGAFQGSVVWWDQEDSETPSAAFRQAWKAQGLDEAHLPETPPPARALRDAGQEALKGRGNKRGEYLLRPAGTQGATYFYALVREDQTTVGSLHHGQHATFQVDPDGTLRVAVFDPACRPQASAVEANYRRILGTYQSRDIRECVTRAIKGCAGVSLRSHGGVYWVPAPFQGTVEAIKRVIDGVGRSVFSVLPIHGTALGQEAVQTAARRSLEEELRDLKAELDGWSLEVAHGDGPRPSTVRRRIEDFADLAQRADLYRDILSLQVDSITAALQAAQEQARKILIGMDETK